MDKEQMERAFKVGRFVRNKAWEPYVCAKILGYTDTCFQALMFSGGVQCGDMMYIKYGGDYERTLKDGRIHTAAAV